MKMMLLNKVCENFRLGKLLPYIVCRTTITSYYRSLVASLIAFVIIIFSLCSCESIFQEDDEKKMILLESPVAQANNVIIESGFEIDKFIVTSIEDQAIPYEVSKYCADSDRGQGSTKPVIYRHKEEKQYLIVYQQNDGAWVVVEFLLQPEGDWVSNELS